ncbi:monocarboxylate transporter 12-like [Mizuhopecten yessoensis]|uniref:Monocarboxylate transporter 9 n=1 Tax=Mizuhopecten yessoensis TaxID=6573 RepID=A0A210PI47_MIZYE|nr:monocarboxylate transporter 12-like [Mizuhopecten yessoensis]XP_021341241.1 monocarboxylate transporter 12-like [Mizuhopecten yessoensis]XP_021341243.1 monocarboxylate transporter 12-like [Mizuhopecten yessoensis]XP_021341244.1 monocarboxylate transporter 12-like [Mizuhopecten yessoensis]XP_021341245.1 monocarboxylate transporter 12-like [Mizuhopecten yessoensis]XP_021341246.1 monocarboxylate transporter 12-like [Mizuhopecten yessoensis]XP_021341247.1 monocarboxylate transporter 12-like [M
MATGGKEKENGTISKGNRAVPPQPPTPPDGGWGWVITFSSFMVSFLVDGVCFTFGIFFPEFLRHFGESKGKTQILGSVLNGAYLSLGPVAGALVNKFGCRKVAIAGAFVSSIGLFLSTFSPNLDVMILLYGGVGGCGFGLIYLPAIVMVGYYFDKRRAFATGIAVCGSGIGGFVFAPLCVFLLETYGWQGAMWVISGIVFNGAIFASFYRPIEENKSTCENMKCTQITSCNSNSEKECFIFQENGNKNIKPNDLELNPIYRCRSVEIKCDTNGTDCAARLAFSQDLSLLNTGTGNPKQSHAHKTHLSPLIRKDIFYSGSLEHIPERVAAKSDSEYVSKMTVQSNEDIPDSIKISCCARFCVAFKETFDFSLLASPTFLLYGVSCFLCMFGFFIPFNFLPALAQDLDLSIAEGALLISIIGISNTVTRILVGWVSDQPWADCLLINNVALLIGGLITCFVPYYKIYSILAIYSVFFGAAIASFVSLRSIIMVELMGIERLTNAFGMVTLCQGLSSFIGSPIAGALADETGDYNITFYLSGVTLGLAGLICFPLRRISKWEQGKNSQGDETVVPKVSVSMPEKSPMLD